MLAVLHLHYNFLLHLINEKTIDYKEKKSISYNITFLMDFYNLSDILSLKQKRVFTLTM